MDEIPEWVNVMELKEYAAIKKDVNQPPINMIVEHIREKRVLYAIKLMSSYIYAKISGDYSLYYKTVFKKVPVFKQPYDVAVSYSSIITYISWFVIYHVTAAEKVGWIHFDVSKFGCYDKVGLKLHRKMNRIYVVSEEALESFTEMYPALKDKCELKYSYIDKKYIKKQALEPVESLDENAGKVIMTLGRLSEEKGQDIIPDVAKIMRDKGIFFKWYLIGDGKLRNKLEEKISNLNLEDDVVLLGTKKNPYPYMCQADIYVQTSLHEGYCLSLAEAGVFELPVVTTDFAGAHEQLNGRENTRIVCRGAEQIAEAIIALYDK